MEFFISPYLIALSICAIYIVGLAVYRLYLSPLTKFPGPKLAALTLWYEFYYDVIKRGQYTWKIAELHKQYGRSPIAGLIKQDRGIEQPHRPDLTYQSL